MLRSCVCFGQRSVDKRRSSSLDTSSSCRSSEIARGGKTATTVTIAPTLTGGATTTTTTTIINNAGSKNTRIAKLKRNIHDNSAAATSTTNASAIATPNANATATATPAANATHPLTERLRMYSTTPSLLQLLQTKSWYRHWFKPPRDMNNMSKVEITIKAALLIQRWYRRHAARMEIKRRYTWSIFTNLEYAGEQDQVELYNFFNALLTHIPKAAAGLSESASLASSLDNIDSKFSDESDFNEEYDKFGAKYTGPVINFPLTKKDIDVLINLFRRKKSNRLHAKYVGGILKEAALHLRRLPNLNEASTAISKQITICGDLHGKLDDLLVVFYKNGLPSSENPYIFNGDFVDRGKKSLEVLLLLLACLLAFPNAVYLNRGNHEDPVMNTRYGFTREVQEKYKRNSLKLLKLIDEVYRWLPLGSIINNRVLVVHGGISDTTSLDLIKSLDRGKYVSILRPPVVQSNNEGIDKAEWKQLFDIMWSDPQHTDGCIPNSLRGAGSYFGPDVTKKFLEEHKLNFLVRSHECKVGGYEYAHDQLVVTIFSASNYYAIGSNRGAYMKLNPQLKPHFIQYISAASKTRQLTFNQRVGIVESSAIRGLGARLRAKRTDLEVEFQKHDPQNTGSITISQWCEAMEKATNLGLPWRLLKSRLVVPSEDESSNHVNYLTTLELLDTDTMIKAQEMETSVADSLYKNVSNLETIFRMLDQDHSGSITLSEFSDACDLLEKHLPGANTREQLLNMCRMMDLNKDGLVDLNEFLEAFRLADQARSGHVYRPSATLQTKELNDSDVSDKSYKSDKSDNEESSHLLRDQRHSSTVAALAQELQALDAMNDVENDIDPSDCESNS